MNELPVAPAPHEASASRRIVTNTSALSSAGLWRIGVAFVLQVWVARSLGAASLGAYVLGLALLNIAQVVVEAGLPALLVRELAAQTAPGAHSVPGAQPAPRTRRATYALARWSMLAIAILLTAGVALAALLLRRAGGSLNLAPLALLFASLPFYALMAAALAMCEAAERFELVLLVDASSNALLLVVTGTALALGGGVTATFGALVAVQAVGALLTLVQLRRLAGWFAEGAAAGERAADGESGAAGEDSGSASAAALALLRRARPTFGIALTDVLQQRLDLLLVGALLAPAATAFYAAAGGLVRVLLKLTQSWWRALFPTLSRLRSQGAVQARKLNELATRLGLAGVVLAAVLLSTAALPIVSLLFGADYAEAAPVLRVLAWSAPFYFLNARAVVLLQVAQRARWALWVALAQVGALLLLPLTVSALGAAAAAPTAVLAAALAALVATRLLSALPTQAGLELDNQAARTLRSFALIAAGALIAAAASALPLAWPLQSAAALGALLLLYGLTATVTPADVQRLLRAVRGPVLPPAA